MEVGEELGIMNDERVFNINFHEFIVNISKNIMDNLWEICGN